MEKNEDQIN